MQIKGKDINFIGVGREKEIIDRQKAFIKELEITKARLEIRPRKVNMMQAQELMLQDIMDMTKQRRLYIPGKEGFI